MFPMRHYPHLAVRIHPDRIQAIVLLLSYTGIAGLAWLLPLSGIKCLLLGAPVFFLGAVKALHVMQFSGAWSVREIVHTGTGRWILVDARGRREKAKLLYHGEIDTRLMLLQFSDAQRRFRSVLLTSLNSHPERRHRLATRLFYGLKQPVEQPVMRSGICSNHLGP